MKVVFCIFVFIISFFHVPQTHAQPGLRRVDTIIGQEPDPYLLGAPLFPGAVFLRADALLRPDPDYVVAFYITSEPEETVNKFFSEKLPEARFVQSMEAGLPVTVVLLADWIDIDRPRRVREINILDRSPNIQIRKFDPQRFQNLMEYLRDRGETLKVEQMKKASTLIRYTYETVHEDTDLKNAIGRWKNTNRGIREFFGSELVLFEDRTYMWTFTDGNLRHLSGVSAFHEFEGTPEDVYNRMKKNNPERGKFSLIDGKLALESSNPVIGKRLKGGLVEPGKATLTTLLYPYPRLTFIRMQQMKK